MNIPLNKAALRTRYTALRQAISSQARPSLERQIYEHLFSLPVWQNAPLVCGYMSMRGEIDLRPIWNAAIQQGKAYALPCTVTDRREGRMIYRRVPQASLADLSPARYGIWEPSDACPALTANELSDALILVPGLAFDDHGFRIGYGGGYYDRFLDTLAQTGVRVTTVGLLFSACRADILPHQAHDIPVDYMIDERSVTATHGTTDTYALP